MVSMTRTMLGDQKERGAKETELGLGSRLQLGLGLDCTVRVRVKVMIKVRLWEFVASVCFRWESSGGRRTGRHEGAGQATMPGGWTGHQGHALRAHRGLL